MHEAIFEDLVIDNAVGIGEARGRWFTLRREVGANYFHPISTAPPPGFSDRPKALKDTKYV